MSKVVLSEGHVTPDSPISVQLIKQTTMLKLGRSW